MGDRGQILIKDTGVYLYTHWDATNLINVVRKVISRKDRWNDSEYLTRMLFSEMTKGSEFESTGFGIGTEEHGDIWRLITIDCENQIVSLGEDGNEVKLSFQDFIDESENKSTN